MKYPIQLNEFSLFINYIYAASCDKISIATVKKIRHFKQILIVRLPKKTYAAEEHEKMRTFLQIQNTELRSPVVQ